MNVSGRARFLIAIGILVLGGCNRDVASGPPAVQYGQDACAGCGMIVSDDRFAAALINPAPDAAPLVFDDVGCLLAYEHKNPSAAQWTHYFHDITSHQWLTTDQAFFVKTSRETPMGSGIFSFRSRSDADELARQVKGTVQTFDELSHADATASAAR
jgi:copper chaperone NosL